MAQLLSNLPIGTKVKFGKYQVESETPQEIIWIVVAKNHVCVPAYPTNSTTLLTEKIIDLRCFDAREINNTGDRSRSNYGNNRYSLSNIDQWLNKDNPADEWYVATHSADQSPNISSYVGTYNTQYANRPGFLNAFSVDEKNAIQPTEIRVGLCTTDGGSYEDITRKVFLPSYRETAPNPINSTIEKEGAAWAYFADGNSRLCYLTTQCYNNTRSSEKPSSEDTAWDWWLRTAYPSSSHRVYYYTYNNRYDYISAYSGKVGVRPAINLLSTLFVSDTTDSDGCYTIVWNSAPSAPTALNVPISIHGGKSNTISWSSVTDPDGDNVTYVLEAAYDGGDFEEVYSGSMTSYNHAVIFGKISIQYRVKAVDSKGAESGYTTSASRTIINNQPPVISGSDSNLGTKTAGFTQTYSVTDPDNDQVTVIEAIDGVQVRSYVVTLDATNTFYVTGNTWLKQTNGVHTMTITAKDSAGNSLTRTYTFSKNVNTFTVSNTAPMESASMPTRIILTVNRTLPAEATFKVEVCNNGYDSSPAWEDATSAVMGNLVHVFENKSKTAAQWGVRVKITVQRNNGEGACYISAIGGNFE